MDFVLNGVYYLWPTWGLNMWISYIMLFMGLFLTVKSVYDRYNLRKRPRQPKQLGDTRLKDMKKRNRPRGTPPTKRKMILANMVFAMFCVTIQGVNGVHEYAPEADILEHKGSSVENDFALKRKMALMTRDFASKRLAEVAADIARENRIQEEMGHLHADCEGKVCNEGTETEEGNNLDEEIYEKDSNVTFQDSQFEAPQTSVMADEVSNIIDTEYPAPVISNMDERPSTEEYWDPLKEAFKTQRRPFSYKDMEDLEERRKISTEAMILSRNKHIIAMPENQGLTEQELLRVISEIRLGELGLPIEGDPVWQLKMLILTQSCVAKELKKKGETFQLGYMRDNGSKCMHHLYSTDVHIKDGVVQNYELIAQCPPHSASGQDRDVLRCINQTMMKHWANNSNFAVRSMWHSFIENDMRRSDELLNLTAITNIRKNMNLARCEYDRLITTGPVIWDGSLVPTIDALQRELRIWSIRLDNHLDLMEKMHQLGLGDTKVNEILDQMSHLRHRVHCLSKDEIIPDEVVQDWVLKWKSDKANVLSNLQDSSEIGGNADPDVNEGVLDRDTPEQETPSPLWSTGTDDDGTPGSSTDIPARSGNSSMDTREDNENPHIRSNRGSQFVSYSYPEQIPIDISIRQGNGPIDISTEIGRNGATITISISGSDDDNRGSTNLNRKDKVKRKQNGTCKDIRIKYDHHKPDDDGQGGGSGYRPGPGTRGYMSGRRMQSTRGSHRSRVHNTRYNKGYSEWKLGYGDENISGVDLNTKFGSTYFITTQLSQWKENIGLSLKTVALGITMLYGLYRRGRLQKKRGLESLYNPFNAVSTLFWNMGAAGGGEDEPMTLIGIDADTETEAAVDIRVEIYEIRTQLNQVMDDMRNLNQIYDLDQIREISASAVMEQFSKLSNRINELQNEYNERTGQLAIDVQEGQTESLNNTESILEDIMQLFNQFRQGWDQFETKYEAGIRKLVTNSMDGEAAKMYSWVKSFFEGSQKVVNEQSQRVMDDFLRTNTVDPNSATDERVQDFLNNYS